MKLIVVDVLENASRKMKNKEYNEVILLSYRAAEAAVQANLFEHKINSWEENEYSFKNGFDKIN
ncbi:MAG: HEPN domain-containing protein [candidate division WOR-3 bacterium]|nr:HEPN domain-containing protein [candidate division WOR-3 bacterium]MCX7837281.1 HEPN domain-containing protein [candidate division WOR-3 bacterium]MDW8113716.1 HEPN domain-containing protein [candidate division WOR-3 bacterium]